MSAWDWQDLQESSAVFFGVGSWRRAEMSQGHPKCSLENLFCGDFVYL